MAAAYDAENAHADEWRLWPAREDVTFRRQTAVGAYTNHALSAAGGAVKRRAITWKEMAASAGAYTSRDRAWLVPVANLPAGPVEPKPGDVLLDSGGVSWTIGDVTVGKFGETYKCVARALAIVSGLSASGQLSRPTNAQDSAGRASFGAYANVGGAVACRVQPDDGEVAEVFDRLTIPRKFTAFLETPLSVKAHDRFVVGGVTYTVLGFRNAERIWDLSELVLELIP